MKPFVTPLLLVLMTQAMPRDAWSLGTEDFGNQPLSEANFDAWAGVMPVINDSQRVYHWWVNGNEKFFFRGNTQQANAALEHFAKITADRLEVILRPGPGVTQNFAGEKVKFNWNLHLIGGIAAGMQREDQGALIWVNYPVLTIFVGGDVSLSELKVPDGVNLLQLADLQRRYARALETSTSKTVRGWACGQIAELDRFNAAAMYRLAKALTDEDDWVKLNAAGAMASYGDKAKPALKQLRAAANSDDQQLRTRAIETLEKINAAKPAADEEQRHVAMINAIADFCQRRDAK